MNAPSLEPNAEKTSFTVTYQATTFGVSCKLKIHYASSIHFWCKL